MQETTASATTISPQAKAALSPRNLGQGERRVLHGPSRPRRDVTGRTRRHVRDATLEKRFGRGCGSCLRPAPLHPSAGVEFGESGRVLQVGACCAGCAARPAMHETTAGATTISPHAKTVGGSGRGRRDWLGNARRPDQSSERGSLKHREMNPGIGEARWHTSRFALPRTNRPVVRYRASGSKLAGALSPRKQKLVNFAQSLRSTEM